MSQTAMLRTMEAETSALLDRAVADGAGAMDALARAVLAAVRSEDSFDAVGALLRDPSAVVPATALAPLHVALLAGMATGDLLGRYQVTREAGAHRVAIAPLARAFAPAPKDRGARARFAGPGSPAIEPLPPEEAIAYFRDKVPMTRDAFDQLVETYRGVAFTVARQQTVEAVSVVQDWLVRALADGLTFATFRDGLYEAAAAGGISAVNPYHAATVFQTNIQTAYNAGRWEMYHAPETVEAFPAFQYHTVGDDRVRPAHARMDGYVARRDDPVWDVWWPPNGYN